MKQVSQGTILGLLLLALVLSIGGTIVSLMKLNQLGTEALSGAPTSIAFGEANITITGTTSLTNQVNTLNFGSGRVNASCDICELETNHVNVNHYSNGSNASNTSTGVQCCVSFTFVSNGFLLENTGNVNMSINISCNGNCSHASFIGGSLPVTTGFHGLMLKVTPNNVALQPGEDGGTDTAGSCAGGGSVFRDSNWNLTNVSTYTNASDNAGQTPNGNKTGFPAATYAPLTTNLWLCGNQSNYPLMGDNTKDAGVVDINVTIPASAPATGLRSSFNISFTATSSG